MQLTESAQGFSSGSSGKPLLLPAYVTICRTRLTHGMWSKHYFVSFYHFKLNSVEINFSCPWVKSFLHHSWCQSLLVVNQSHFRTLIYSVPHTDQKSKLEVGVKASPLLQPWSASQDCGDLLKKMFSLKEEWRKQDKACGRGKVSKNVTLAGD